ncbi:GIY-YIG nuclease family protein [Lichenihabitans sp. Uapishka_5]|uniref:GIY-YIG nuclease family protein n=1 Tax=Lichenihabitans sp. Uapishka_5 TaxID=3037302 RepID=UPI0029E7E409|nr:GIY-YIG nuclease family protein [Lichenihabitans sp. Uapishka_5]MDX7953924.1 GIY-YIG nuclease family protein [Lichenihabitans sp. Uapishka_5]
MGQVTKSGYIYVLDPNLEVDGRRVLKIGYTTRSVRERVRELSTGMAGTFRVAHQRHVANPQLVEGRVHSALAGSRVKREFFAVTVEKAVAAIDKVVDAVAMEDETFAWNRGMQEFKERTGIAAVERAAEARATQASRCIMAASAAICILGAYIAHPLWLAAVALTPFLSMVGDAKRREWWRRVMVSEPYGKLVSDEYERLNQRYPGSRYATWVRSVGCK